MQATVKSYDPATGVGSVLLDDGQELPLPTGVLDGLRLLRLGQRVHLVQQSGVVTAVRLTPPVEG